MGKGEQVTILRYKKLITKQTTRPPVSHLGCYKLSKQQKACLVFITEGMYHYFMMSRIKPELWSYAVSWVYSKGHTMALSLQK